MSKRFEDYMRDEEQPWLPRVEVPKPTSDEEAGWRDGIAWAMELPPEELGRVGMYCRSDGESPYVLGVIDVDSGDYGPAVESVPLDEGPWIQFASSVLWLSGNQSPTMGDCWTFWREAGSPDEQPSDDYVGGFCDACEFIADLVGLPYVGRRDRDDFSWVASLYRYNDCRPVLVDIAGRMPTRAGEEFLGLLFAVAVIRSEAVERHCGLWCPMMLGRPEVGNVLATVLGKDHIRFIRGGVDTSAFKVGA